MLVFVNKQSLDIPENSALLAALQQTGLVSFQGMAVAVNNQVIQKAKWNEYILNENDKITVIRATQGG